MDELKEQSVRTYEVIISITALVLFGVLFTVTELFKSPFIVLGVILFILLPFKRSRLIRVLLWLSVIIFTLWFLHSLSQILIPFIIAFLISYILNPLVDKLTTKKIPRTLSCLLILIGFIAIIVLAAIFIVPVIILQFTEFINTLPMTFKGVQGWFQVVLIPWLSTTGIPTQDLQNKIVNELPGRFDQIFYAFVGSLSGIFTGLSIILSQIINIIIIPFITFYILKDFEKIKSGTKKLFPVNAREKYVKYYHQIDELLGRYLRGALIVAFINGTLMAIILSIIGIRYSILLGALSGLLDLIPYFGLLISLVLSTLVALFSGNPLIQAPLTILTYIALNILETSFLAPRIIGKKIGLHPAVLILSLLVFSYFFGFLGLLIALPTVSIILMFAKEWYVKRESGENINRIGEI
ncbi:MAG: AI-2E family transporter [Ignavibacteria bacterium]|jgi:predicted PurR-regulated permease PerM